MDHAREAPRVLLIGTRLAPPVELMRWLHEVRKLAYDERAHAPVFHALSSWRYGVPIELPLVVTPQGPIGGLRNALIAFDEACRPGERLFGEAEEERTRNLALFDELDRLLFRQAVQIYYRFMLEVPEVAMRGALDGAPAWQSAFVGHLYPLWRGMMRRGLKLDAFDLDEACASIDGAFARVEALLDGGARFLGGDRPNGLDITFAALASPILLPARHGANAPRLDEIPAEFRTVVEAYRATRAGALALQTYETRPTPQPPMRRPRGLPSLATLLTAAPVLRMVARLFVRFGPRKIGFRGAVAVFRWLDVTGVLDRDGDFRIAPINARRIEAVSGPFILGMDRSEALFAQRKVTYGALRHARCDGVRRVLAQEPRRLLAAAASRWGRIDVVSGYARPVAARTAARLFGIAGPTEPELMRVARAAFHETFLNLGNDTAVREAGIAAGRELRGWIDTEAAARRARGTTGDDVLGALMAAEARGELTPNDLAHILAGLLVGAIDTTATAVAHIVAELLADARLHAAMLDDINRPALLAGWCWEALRRRPHNPILLREAAAGAQLCGTSVAAGTRVIAVTISAMQDPRVFDAPGHMRPTRPPHLYLHLGRGVHLCAGRDVNQVQIPGLVGTLLRFRPSRFSGLRSRGPFPDELVVRLGGAS